MQRELSLSESDGGKENMDYESEHEAVLFEAMRLYKTKSHVRGQMWLEWPPSDKIRELRERVMRLEGAYANRERLMPETPGPEIPHAALDKAIIEDSLDLINYAAFLIKQIRRGMNG
jgi:hypothetical protein